MGKHSYGNYLFLQHGFMPTENSTGTGAALGSAQRVIELLSMKRVAARR